MPMYSFRVLHSPDDPPSGAGSSGDFEIDAPRDTAAPDSAGDPAPRSRAEQEALARELAEQQRSAREWEHRYKAAVRDRELAMQLAGRPLVPGAASQLLKLWRDEFDVIEEAGVERVVSREGANIQQTIESWLGRAEYAHFVRPVTRGGFAGTQDGRLTDAATAVEAPRTLGEAALRQWRQERPRPGAGEAPIGLHRRQR
jgi:hypothetical protein